MHEMMRKNEKTYIKIENVKYFYRKGIDNTISL